MADESAPYEKTEQMAVTAGDEDRPIVVGGPATQVTIRLPLRFTYTHEAEGGSIVINALPPGTPKPFKSIMITGVDEGDTNLTIGANPFTITIQ